MVLVNLVLRRLGRRGGKDRRARGELAPAGRWGMSAAFVGGGCAGCCFLYQRLGRECDGVTKMIATQRVVGPDQ